MIHQQISTQPFRLMRSHRRIQFTGKIRVERQLSKGKQHTQHGRRPSTGGLISAAAAAGFTRQLSEPGPCGVPHQQLAMEGPETSLTGRGSLEAELRGVSVKDLVRLLGNYYY